MLMAGLAKSNRLTLVKPRSTWVITSKTEPTTPIDPLEQVNTPLWSTFGQRHGQTPLKPWRRWMSSGTFAAFSKFHLNTSKSTNMKVVQFFRGTQLSCRLAFPNLRGERWKMWSTASSSCSPRHGSIQFWQAVSAKSVEKNTLEPL
jgi:hypothetical protein